MGIVWQAPSTGLLFHGWLNFPLTDKTEENPSGEDSGEKLALLPETPLADSWLSLVANKGVAAPRQATCEVWLAFFGAAVLNQRSPGGIQGSQQNQTP